MSPWNSNARVLPSDGQEAQRGRHLAAELIDTELDRELGAIGLDRILEQHVEKLLGPVELEARIERRPFQVRQRLLVGGKRFVGRQRYTRVDHTRRRERRIVLGTP